MRRFRRLFRHVPDRADLLAREWDDEIQSHIAARAEQFAVRGMSIEEASREALRRFGDVEAARAHSTASAERRASNIRTRERLAAFRTLLGGLSQDAKLGVRGLRAHPAFAVATIATLGLAISAAVTAFSFADAMFLRPLPAPAADRLVHVYLPRGNGRVTQVGEAGANLLRARTDLFQRVASERCCWVKFVRERGALDQRFAGFASSDFFPMLGVAPALGRFFLPSETSDDGRDPVVVLGYSLWRQTFASDPRAIGEHILVGGRDFTIVGVAPPGFAGVSYGAAPADIWLPSTMIAAVGIRCEPAIPCDDMDVLARLAPGVSDARAAVGIQNLGAALSAVAVGDDSARRPIVMRASGALIQSQRAYSPLARLLGAIAAVLLLIACANLSGLLIVRGVSRGREIALRRSLGASRIRIVQQLLVESALLGVAGGALGLLLSVWTEHRLMTFFVTDSEGFETYFRVGLDPHIVWFALGISLAATLLFGLLPALIGTRAQPADVLKSGTPGSGRAHARYELVTVQVALTSALLCGAVLLSASFDHLIHAQQFDPDHVALFRVRPAAAQYPPARAQAYVHAVARRVAALPGVENVGYARGSGFVWGSSPADVGVGTAPADSAERAEAHFVSSAFFKTLRIPIIAGREFDRGDGAGTPLVAIVSASLTHTLSPSGDVVGRTLYARGKAFRVVGVVPDYQVRMHGEHVPPMVFFAFEQNALGDEADARFAVRVRGDPAAALSTLRLTAQSVDAGVPVAEFMTLAHQVDASYVQIRLGQTVLLATGALALFLSAIGLYGMIAFLVTRRTRDIGVRIALGAPPARVAGEFAADGMRALVAGLAIGIAGAWMLGHLLDAWLVGVPAHDAGAFAVAGGAVVIAGTIACVLPARRAAGIDPAVALRAE